ncbi:MAG: penicillin-binding protein [Lentimicrobiaceae bacterium]|jgi:cell division protein FtsI (penicillin-binding protein 3)
MDSRKSILTRVYLVYGFLFAISLAIIGKIFYIQLVEGDMWKAKAEKLSLKYFTIEPNRGNIYDVNGEMLATSVPLFEVRMDAASPLIPDSTFNKEVDSLSICLSKYFKDRSIYGYKTILINGRKHKNRYLLIKRKVTFDELKALKTFPIFRLGKNSGGLITTVQNKRVYPFDNLGYRTLGWYKEGNPNNVGIENAFNSEMQGIAGNRLFQRIPDGNWRPMNRGNEIDPVNGADILTTIDINIQDVAEEALLQQLELNQADHGCAILMEVKTGEIRAIANLGRTKTGTYEELYNYAIGESTEPGSTFKLFSLLAAFEDGKVKLTDLVDVTGGVTQYGRRTMRDSHMGGGVMTVQQAFEKSSNVGISKIIYRSYVSNPQAFIDRLHSFSVNKKLGLEIRGEGKPQILGTKDGLWSNSSLPWMSIGYEVALTPLQILTFYNAVANDGVMVKPHFVKEIRMAGMPVTTFGTQVINPKIASKKSIAMAKTMLEAVVDHGTGSALKNPIYKVAGKTGTAQVAQNSGGYNKTNYKGSFVGYFPADNPKYSCIVVINNPTVGGYYGGAISAPVFREIADRIYATDPEVGMNWIDTTYTTRTNPLQAGNTHDIRYLSNWLGYSMGIPNTGEWITQVSDSYGTRFAPVDADNKTIPSVIGMGASDAVFRLEKLGVKVQLNGVGLVKQQSLPAGSKISPGTPILLSLGFKK